MKMPTFLQGLLKHPAFCSHEFLMEDLKQTGIPEPAKPPKHDYKAWNEYFAAIYVHDSVTKRVKWPCRKCGKTFFAHCGLDIIPKHGKIVKK